MVNSLSNVHAHLVLDVSLIAANNDGATSKISITLPNFPLGKGYSVFEERDQQLVGLKEILQKYAYNTEILPGEKFTVAAFLSEMANLNIATYIMPHY